MLSKKLNVVFAGTPDFAAQILKSILNTYHISAVYTQPDRESGRGRKVTPSEVKQVTLNHNANLSTSANYIEAIESIETIKIEQPINFKDPDSIKKLQQYHPDLIIVVAYGIILPQAVLDIPKYGCINIHASKLPRWRGAAPIQRAIMAGDHETGISIQQMERGLDTGPVICESTCTIEETDNTPLLTAKLLKLAIELLPVCLEKIIHHNIHPKIQDNSLATYAHKLSKEESSIDWTQSAQIIHQKIRGLYPWPSATSSINNNIFKLIEAKVINHQNNELSPGSIIVENKRIIVQTGQYQLELLKLQFSGSKPVTAQDILNGKLKELFLHHSLQ